MMMMRTTAPIPIYIDLFLPKRPPAGAESRTDTSMSTAAPHRLMATTNPCGLQVPGFLKPYLTFLAPSSSPVRLFYPEVNAQTWQLQRCVGS